jgi:Leucine-rich repeat (LRR) protein
MNHFGYTPRRLFMSIKEVGANQRCLTHYSLSDQIDALEKISKQNETIWLSAVETADQWLGAKQKVVKSRLFKLKVFLCSYDLNGLPSKSPYIQARIICKVAIGEREVLRQELQEHEKMRQEIQLFWKDRQVSADMQPTCADLQLKLLPVTAMLRKEKQRVSDTVDFAEELMKWCEVEKDSTGCKEAYQRILDCYENQSRELTLVQLKLKSLPEVVGKLVSLRRLDVSHTGLETFPSGIGKLDNLVVLQAFSNKLRALPEEISNLKQLKVLNVSYNELGALPLKIDELKNLKVLDICMNKITDFGLGIGSLTKLRELEFLHNRCRTPPAGMDNLKNLPVLNNQEQV